MLSPIELITVPLLNISYERLLNDKSGIGINGIFYLGNNSNNNDNYDNNNLTQISPYYRMYFGRKYAAGFFVEAFTPITTTNQSTYNFQYNQSGYSQSFYTYEKKTTIGAGIGFGGKWLVRSNILFEASAGVARRFGEGNYDQVTGKGMLGIGYRF
ncbi:DUF3575 domain-containing protein [Halpernia frigidisoli]|nr:DUF3575 domain-containing protein [Halpernia frigidisoli]